MKVLALGASNSKNSINQQLAHYAAKQLADADINLIDLNDYEMPIYSEDREKESGIHSLAQKFFEQISNADLVVIAFAEYNGTYTAAFKNIFDWASRIDMGIYQNKKVLMLATSPGDEGAKTVLKVASSSASYSAAQVIGAISLPSFYDNFDQQKNIVTNEQFNFELQQAYSSIN